MGSHVATIHLIHKLVLRDVQRREQLRRGCSNRAGRARMPRAMPGPLLGEPWAREPHLARGELGHAARQGRPRLGRARPCQAAAQAGRAEPPRRPRGTAAALPRRLAAGLRVRGSRPGRPRRGHARRGHIAHAGAAVAEAACPAEIDARPCRRGWLGAAPASRAAARLRPPPGSMPVARARSPWGRGRRAPARRAGDACSRQGVVPRPPAPGRRGRRAGEAEPLPRLRLRPGHCALASRAGPQRRHCRGAGEGEGEGERRRGRERDVRGIGEGEKEVGERGWG